MSVTLAKGRCQGCGEDVEIDVPPDGHTRTEYEERTIWGHERACYEKSQCVCSGVPAGVEGIPYPVLCGPVSTRTEE